MSAMNVEEYALPPTSRLRWISITQIVLGALAVIGSVYDLIGRRTYYGFYVACAVLLVSTGVHGVRAIRRLRMRILDCRSFRILGAANVVLCIFYSLILLFLLLAVVSRSKLHAFDLGNDNDDDEKPIKQMYDDRTWRSDMILVGSAVAIVPAVILIGLTAAAATMSFRLSASILAANRQPVMVPPAGIPLMAGPGYGTYPVPYMEPPVAYMEPPPAYSACLPVKQNID